MAQPPYNDARRVFWILDNGSSHRGVRSIARLRLQYPRLVPVHGPVPASWLNQVEIYFSVLQRKALTPNDFASLAALEERILGWRASAAAFPTRDRCAQKIFQRYYESIASPFQWRFTRADLARLLAKIQTQTQQQKAA